MEYDIKKGWYKNIEGDALEELMRSVFGNVSRKGDELVSSYGALSSITVTVVSKSRMNLITTAGLTVSDEEILDTKRRLNEFVEKATGFNAKQRMKRAQQKAKQGAL
ncbi:MAG: DUF5611 family protein [Candidatus Methanomethylophilaceae archaeon]|jgi:hypothetical protein